MPKLKLTGITQDDMTSNEYVDERITYIDSEAIASQRNIVVGDASEFKIGDQVVVYDNMNGFETAVIDSIVGNTLTMKDNLSNSYPEGSSIGKYLGYLDTLNNKFTRLLAPDLGDGSDGAFVSTGNTTWSSEKNFTSILIQAGHTIYISGNIQIKCQGNIEIEAGGIISAKGRGHSRGSSGDPWGYQGSSYIGSGDRANEANGGGGGGGDGSGSSSYRSGGGGGGYGSAGGRSNKYGGDYGYGGEVYNNESLSNTFSIEYLRGSGGGGGGSNYQMPGWGHGGHGGGIIRLHCKNMVVNGEIDCDGNDGLDGGDENTHPGSYYSAGGGGGSGGTIFIQVLNKADIGTGYIHARGGTRGLGINSSGTNDSYGNGGNGGNGRIRIEAGKVVGTTSPGFYSGYSNERKYAKYGWYFTKELKVLNETITVNGYFKQKAVIKINLASIANSGQADIELTDASDFEVGDRAILLEDEKMKLVEVQGIVSNTLTVTEELQNTYSTNAQLIRIDAYGLISLEPVGDDENLQDMMLQSIEDLGDDIWYLSYSKTIKAMNNQDAGVRLVGCVKLKGKSNNTNEINVKEVNWNYF